MVQCDGRIVFNRQVKPEYSLMEIEAPSVTKKAKPGQFVTIRCGKSTTPLLRRPFGFHKLNGSSFQILYEVIGPGTRALSALRTNQKVNILGPLGNGFVIPDRKKDCILVAGGIGVAPLAALAEAIVKTKGGGICAIIGARNEKSLLCEKDFSGLGINTFVATEDGSRGKKALATELLEETLKVKRLISPTIFACGPEAMLKSVANISRRQRLEGYASFEENIACGVGACLGCAIKTKSGYKLVCKDGPVFNLTEIIWQ